MSGKGNLIRVLGVVASIGGVVASLLGDWVNSKKMDEMISAKIEERMAKNESSITDDGSEEDEEE